MSTSSKWEPKGNMAYSPGCARVYVGCRWVTRAHARTFAYLLVGNCPIDPGVTAVHKNRHATHRNAAPKAYLHALGEGNRQGVSINKVAKMLYLSCACPITKRTRNAGGRKAGCLFGPTWVPSYWLICGSLYVENLKTSRRDYVTWVILW